MTARRLWLWFGGLLAVGGFAGTLTWWLARWDRQAPVPVPVAAEPAALAHITATLFYASADGLSLMPLHREVQLEPGVVAQGRQIVLAQIQAPPAPAIGVVPTGTTLRAFYVTALGDAFVDLSGDVVRGHPGGARQELLTVQAIVHAVTANLPTVRRVQILVDGQEVDTLAGHIDLRRPLARDPTILAAVPGPAPGVQ